MPTEDRVDPARRSIREWAADDRPRERLMKLGPSALSEAELVAILLRTGSSKNSALDMARDLLHSANNDLNTLFGMRIPELTRIKGMGPAKAITLVAAMELGRRRKDTSLRGKVRIASSAQALDEFPTHLADLPHEEFWVIFLDQGNGIIDRMRVGQGGITGTVADPRVIFKEALDRRAAGIIVAHNHPSGRTRPSEEDIRLTRKLLEAGRLLDIMLHDHLIIAVGGYYSFADNGAL